MPRVTGRRRTNTLKHRMIRLAHGFTPTCTAKKAIWPMRATGTGAHSAPMSANRRKQSGRQSPQHSLDSPGESDVSCLRNVARVFLLLIPSLGFAMDKDWWAADPRTAPTSTRVLNKYHLPAVARA